MSTQIYTRRGDEHSERREFDDAGDDEKGPLNVWFK